MTLKALATATLLASGIATSSHALTSIKCTEYVIVLPEELAIAAEIRAGSTREMNRIVCDRSSSATEDLYQEDNPHRIAVNVEELGMATYVIIFIYDGDEKPSLNDN
ncbi:hypothetical protein [Yoonia sp. R2-816]|uniref:hypothetical protein n=1 Tax=Yoonia sp. R2-816 TaxID=3342638 RepID=UPI003727F506